MKITEIEKAVIGMIHIQALPGSPQNSKSVKEIIKTAIEEAAIYREAEIDALLIENMHDIPYLKSSVGHEISTIMAIIGYEIKNKYKIPCGIQILAGANKEALACANAAGLDFIRAEGFVFGHIADEGYIESSAGELLRYRKQIGAENISIYTDIKKKHSSHAITNDINIVETAIAASFFLSDGLIITGNSTGVEANSEEVIAVKNAVSKPVIIGSGITLDNLNKFFPHADAFIVGSYFKDEGKWYNKLVYNKIDSFMKKIKLLKNQGIF